jgi:uncharacterized protein RhaS with RHS repeats
LFQANASNAVNTSYVMGGRMPLAQCRVGVDYYFLSDVQRSTRLLTAASADIVQGYDYDAFGEMINQPSTLNTSYLYTGQQFDAATDLYSLRACYYTPTDGRFLILVVCF